MAMMKRIKRNYQVIMGINGGLITLGVAGIMQPTTSALLHNATTLTLSLKSMGDLMEKK
jgi:cation transport ATPase